MLHKAIDILKWRWPETMLIVVVGAGLMLLFKQVLIEHITTAPQGGQIPGWAMFVLGFGCALMAVLWQMLYLGFLRTAATDGASPHDPIALLAAGRGFFWQYLGVQLVMGAAMWVVFSLLIGAAAALLGYKDTNVVPLWLMQLTSVASIAALAKPFFLIPSFMLAMNLSAMEAFGMMRLTRLDELGGLPKTYAAGLAVIAAVSVAATFLTAQTPTFYIVATVLDILRNLVMLILMLATILFIGGEPLPPEDVEEAVEG